MNEITDILYKEAKRALKNARARYSRFRVGVSLITEDEKVYTGCNIEDSSLTMSACAEKVAILKALSEGAGGIRAIMIVTGSPDYCYPCGSCRHLIYEFAPHADIYLTGKHGIKKYSIEELLPHGS